MGCGPSKDANVATGNTVKTKSLLKNDADESNNTIPSSSSSSSSSSSTTQTTIVQEDASAVPSLEAKEDAKGSEDAEVKDVLPNAPAVTEEEEGKFVAAGSPDRYFSSRKDEDAVKGATVASTGYFSPPPEIADEEKVVAEAEKTVSDGNSGEEIAAKQEEEGKSSSNEDSVEPKETEVKVTDEGNA